MDPIITKGVAEAPFPNTYSVAILDAIKVINAHVPSLSDKNWKEITGLLLDPESDCADLAIRTCACGARIDGFYQYVDHLVALLGGESHIGG